MYRKTTNWHSFTNPTSIGSTLASAFKLGSRGLGSYLYGSQAQMASNFRSRKRRRLGSRTRTITRRRRFIRRGNRLARRVRRINKFLFRKGINSIETKYYQAQFQTPNTVTGPGGIGTLLDGTLATRTAQVALTSGIARGTTALARIGGKVFIKNVRLKGLVQASIQAKAVNELYVRILVLRVKSAQGNTNSYGSSVPYIPNIWEFINNTQIPPDLNGQNTGRGAFINNWKWYNSRWKNDFQILKLKTIKVAKEQGAGELKRLFRINLRVNKPAHWTETDLEQDGHIYLYYWCDQVVTDESAVPPMDDGDRPTMWCSWRTTFTDV